MALARYRSGLTRAAMAVCALLALAYNVAVPPGFMSARGPDNSIVITICSGQGPMLASIAIPMSGKHHDGDNMDHRPQCAFAGHVAPAALPDLAPPALPTSPRVLAGLPLPRLVSRPGRGMPAPPPPSHAPPSLLA
jgi:hypothetical protein